MMRRPQGYAVWSGPEQQVERDTFTCAHCNAVVIVPPQADPSALGGFCRQCMAHICGPCADAGACRPFEQQLATMEQRDRFLRAVGL